MKCPECGGKGRWQESIISKNDVELVWHECGNCKGTGQIESAEGPAYDIGGDSLDENDD